MFRLPQVTRRAAVDVAISGGSSRSSLRVGTVLRHLSTARAMRNEEVLFEVHGGQGSIVLNRPKALNALNLPMVRSMDAKLREWIKDDEINVVTMKGAGEKAFCAGGDVVSVVNAGPDGALGRDFFFEEYVVDNMLATLKKPYVALMNGITMGGGVGLSVNAKYQVATEKTLFAMPETIIGLFPDVGGGYFLPKLPGALGMYLALTGARLKGGDLLHAGISSHFVQHDNLSDLEAALSGVQNPSFEEVEAVLAKFHSTPETEFSLAPYTDLINDTFGKATVAEIFESLETAASSSGDHAAWAAKQLEMLNKVSPTAVKVTHKQLHLGKDMSLQECLMMEYRITQACMVSTAPGPPSSPSIHLIFLPQQHGKDFFEGVRAGGDSYLVLIDPENCNSFNTLVSFTVLIDKDHAPKWDYPSVHEVPDAEVERHFQPIDNELTMSHLEV